MKIIDFENKHAEAARIIASDNYEEERSAVAALPKIAELPKLYDFAETGRGYAATDGNDLVGFFCWLEPFANHNGLCRGAWSPLHAHGAIKRERAEIYRRLYRRAAEKLVSSNVFSHSVTLYSNDVSANECFMNNGFGRRCVDAMRETAPIETEVCKNISYREAAKCDALFINAAENKAGVHLSKSPVFIPYSTDSVENTEQKIDGGMYRYFLASEHNQPAAYIKTKKSGETFAAEDDTVMNICGAFVLEEFRNFGVASGLLSWLTDWLRGRGYPRCGVDYECFNHAGNMFWSKYFAPYANGMTRRVDERINA